MSEIQQTPPADPAPSQPEQEINLNDMGDRFKVAEYLLKLRDHPPFADDPHPAARFVAEVVAAFADEQMRSLMGADQPAEDESSFPFSDAETQTLKSIAGVGDVLLELVKELQKPAAPRQQQQPAPRPAQQQVASAQAQPLPAARQAPRPGPGTTTMSHIPGRRGPQGQLPQVGTVTHGPLSRPTLSKEEMEATTHAQAQVVARRARNAFLSFRTGANPGRDHAGPDEG